jgi:alcohol dehydrogenase
MSESRAAVFRGTARELELRRFPTPQPQPDEALVRVLGCTLCGSDLHSYEGRRSVSVPTVLGHEIVGEIVALGDAPARSDTPARRDLAGNLLLVGDRITWAIVASCGDCFYCRRGLPQKCQRGVKYGHEAFRPGRELLGGLAEHCLLVPGTAVVKLPDELPLATACPASCATATIVAALEAAGPIRGRTVCILGAGLLGLSACAMARTEGAREVICVDPHAGRVARSLEFGATRAVAPEGLAGAVAATTEGHGADVILELSGSPQAFEAAWPLACLGATMVLIGSVFPSAPVPVQLEAIVRRQLTIRGVHNYAPRQLLTAVQFLAEQHRAFPFAELVAQWFSLEDAAKACEAARNPGQIRIGVRP